MMYHCYHHKILNMILHVCYKTQGCSSKVDCDCNRREGTSEVHLLAGLDQLLRNFTHDVEGGNVARPFLGYYIYGLSHKATFNNLAAYLVKSDDNRRPQLQGRVTWSGELLWFELAFESGFKTLVSPHIVIFN